VANAETIRIASPADASLADIVEECAPGTVIELGLGRWPGDLFITKPLRLVGLRGAAETVLVGSGRGPVVEVEGERIAVSLAGLTLTGGGGRSGAGVSLGGYVELSLVDCVIADNRATASGGGLIAAWGRIRAERCVFAGNAAHAGGALVLTEAAVAELVGCRFEGNAATVGAACAVSGRADARFVRCRFTANTCATRSDGPWGGTAIFAAGTERHRSSVALDHCDLPDEERAVWLAEPWPGQVERVE
jgi:hypothetical protein